MEILIRKIEIYPIEIRLNNPFKISVGSISAAQNTVVLIYSDNGLLGTGECGRLRSIHAETPASVLEVGKYIAPHLIGKDAADIVSCIAIMEKVFIGHSSVKCAFDMALHDIKCKHYNLSLSDYLGGAIADKEIHTDMTVGLASVSKMVEEALEYKAKGFRTLKLKLGEAQDDVDRVREIRSAIGPEIFLRLDANQGWSPVRAKRMLRDLEQYDIQYCEAPIDAKNLVELKKITSESPIPIMADESIFDHKDAFHLLSNHIVDMINIKLTKSGGIHHAMKIVSIAESAGVTCQVGCFAETRVGISALVHFVSVWDCIKYFDMDSPLMHTSDPVHGGITYTDDWKVIVPDGIGHGAHFDESFLAQFANNVFE